MSQLIRTENGYAVKGRNTFIFKVSNTWHVVFRTWGGARETKEFRTFPEAKTFAIGSLEQVDADLAAGKFNL